MLLVTPVLFLKEKKKSAPQIKFPFFQFLRSFFIAKFQLDLPFQASKAI